MENKNGLCEAEVRKNLVLVELGEPLTLPLATLNRSCQFRKEWDRIQDKWHGPTKDELEAKARKKAYRETPEAKAKMKAYSQTPEVKARKKAYYQDNKKDILNKLQKRRNSPKPY